MKLILKIIKSVIKLYFIECVTSVSTSTYLTTFKDKSGSVGKTLSFASQYMNY